MPRRRAAAAPTRRGRRPTRGQPRSSCCSCRWADGNRSRVPSSCTHQALTLCKLNCLAYRYPNHPTPYSGHPFPMRSSAPSPHLAAPCELPWPPAAGRHLPTSLNLSSSTHPDPPPPYSPAARLRRLRGNSPGHPRRAARPARHAAAAAPHRVLPGAMPGGAGHRQALHLRTHHDPAAGACRHTAVFQSRSNHYCLSEAQHIISTLQITQPPLSLCYGCYRATSGAGFHQVPSCRIGVLRLCHPHVCVSPSYAG